MRRLLKTCIPAWMAIALVACGGGGGDAAAVAPAPSPIGAPAPAPSPAPAPTPSPLAPLAPSPAPPPLDDVPNLPSPGSPQNAQYIAGRLVYDESLPEISCPAQNVEAWLVAGQSNAGSVMQMPPAQGRADGRVVQFFGGKCYPMRSPMLGSLTMQNANTQYMAFEAVARAYSVSTGKTVVVATYSLGGTQIEVFSRFSALAPDAAALRARYRIDRFLWQQGEQDLILGTSTADYTLYFEQLVAMVAARSTHIARGTQCLVQRPADSPTALAQEALRQRYPGPDTDLALPLTTEFRYDLCHFSQRGVARFTEVWLPFLGPLPN